MKRDSNDDLRDLVAAAGSPVEVEDTVATVPMVAFAMQGRWFAVSAHAVHEVVARGPITAVPGMQSHVLGLVLVRGRMVPVIDLLGTLGIPRQAGDDRARQRLVVLARGDDEVCVIADETRGVIELPTTSGSARGAVRGEVRWNGHLVAVLDSDAVVGKLAERPG